MKSSYYEFYFPDADDVNPLVITGYMYKLESSEVRKSHFFQVDMKIFILIAMKCQACRH